MRQTKDEFISEQLNMLRGLLGVEVFHKDNLMRRLNIKDNIFAELVKNDLIIKVRKGRYFEYHPTRKVVTKQDITNALEPLRNRKKLVRELGKGKKSNGSIKEAIDLLKNHGYIVLKMC